MQNLTIEVDFDRFPLEHTCDGDDLSPRIAVRGSDAPYLAVIVDDPDAPRGTFTHWIAWNIPSTREIPEGIPPEPRISHPVAAVQGMNDFRMTGYAGPCPPRRASHRFFIRVWSVGRELDIPPGSGRAALENALAAAATGYGETMATYERRRVPASPPGAGTRT
ncbi:YbhB/YbcL family Raf kinase inhibitor-like protein [Methanoculleus sp. FWC-SCC3]|uniref:YbhB/YbcL family Raf kinase inhibitor-like protein n=1 Tax=Methanoculleus methanifontis TaxID=2584086 RepID=A0ABT8M2I0_9EURY|nr:YbhB/YbcL family Raf kinase inhibitor-like protein [Methanoculleus sp. FWC-SCC3]MDN7012095.1 YbhB/YbcL family Raf kinase inhibitor-like protein [Methanoculleus sp. FWC-SCC3]